MNKVIVIILVIAVVAIISAFIFKQSLLGAVKKAITLKYFDLSEFDSPAIASIDTNVELYTKNGVSYIKNSGRDNMDLAFLYKLDKARDEVEKEWNKDHPDSKIVFDINSGYRTKHYNATLEDSVDDSEHVLGKGADISLAGYNDAQIKVVLKALVNAGFKRFGLGTNYVHAGSDETKTTPALWNYGSGSIDINPFDLVNN